MNIMEVNFKLPNQLSEPSERATELLESLVELVNGASGPFEDAVPSEVADALTPVWNDQVWQLFVDLALYDVADAPTAGPDGMSSTEWARGLVLWAIQTTVENLQASPSGGNG